MRIRQKVDFTFGRPRKPKLSGKTPTVSRMMALAIFYENLIKNEKIQSISDIARLEKVSQQRASQMMNLLLLSPTLQEKILTLPRQHPYSKHISTEKCIRIAKEIDFEKQQTLFNQMYKKR